MIQLSDSARAAPLRFAHPGQTGASRHFRSVKALGVAARAAYHATVGRGLCSRRLQPLPSLPPFIALPPVIALRRCHYRLDPQSPATPSL